MRTERLLLENEDGLEVEIPSKFEVCGRCEGRGVHDHPAFSNGITSSEWAEDWDDESREEYLRGSYDVRCEDCGGDRVELVPDEDRMTDEQRELWEGHCQMLHEEAAERRMRERGIEF